MRTSKITPNSVIKYTLDKNRPYAQVLEERNGAPGANNALIVRYTYGLDLIAQHRVIDAENSTTSYYHHDGQPSTRSSTRPQAN